MMMIKEIGTASIFHKQRKHRALYNGTSNTHTRMHTHARTHTRMHVRTHIIKLTVTMTKHSNIISSNLNGSMVLFSSVNCLLGDGGVMGVADFVGPQLYL